MGAGCAPLVAGLFLFCRGGVFVVSLSGDMRADVIDAFRTASRFLDDVLDIGSFYFENVVGQMCLLGLRLNRDNASDAKAALLHLRLSILDDNFLPGFVVGVATLVLRLSVSGFWMMVFLALHPVGSVSFSSFVLLERLAVLLASTLTVDCRLGNFLDKAISVVNLAKPFLNFKDDAVV